MAIPQEFMYTRMAALGKLDLKVHCNTKESLSPDRRCWQDPSLFWSLVCCPCLARLEASRERVKPNPCQLHKRSLCLCIARSGSLSSSRWFKWYMGFCECSLKGKQAFGMRTVSVSAKVLGLRLS